MRLVFSPSFILGVVGPVMVIPALVVTLKVTLRLLYLVAMAICFLSKESFGDSSPRGPLKSEFRGYLDKVGVLEGVADVTPSSVSPSVDERFPFLNHLSCLDSGDLARQVETMMLAIFIQYQGGNHPRSS